MENVEKFFVEFELTNGESRYWLPVIINASNYRNAAKVKVNLESILQKEFTLTQRSGLKVFSKITYSEILQPLIENNNAVMVALLKLKELEINHFDDLEEIILNENISIKPQHLLLNLKHTIQSHLEDQSFLTTQFHDTPDYEKEYLVLRF